MIRALSAAAGSWPRRREGSRGSQPELLLLMAQLGGTVPSLVPRAAPLLSHPRMWLAFAMKAHCWLLFHGARLATAAVRMGRRNGPGRLGAQLWSSAVAQWKNFQVLKIKLTEWHYWVVLSALDKHLFGLGMEKSIILRTKISSHKKRYL